jgi:hypothetical protein
MLFLLFCSSVFSAAAPPPLNGGSSQAKHGLTATPVSELISMFTEKSYSCRTREVVILCEDSADKFEIRGRLCELMHRIYYELAYRIKQKEALLLTQAPSQV